MYCLVLCIPYFSPVSVMCNCLCVLCNLASIPSMHASSLFCGICFFLHFIKEHVVYTHEHFWCKRSISFYCAPVVLYVYVLCTTLPVYCARVAHFFSAEYNLFCIWLQDMLTTHMTISAAKYALLCTKRSNSSTGIYLKAIYGIISVIFTI